MATGEENTKKDQGRGDFMTPKKETKGKEIDGDSGVFK